MIEKCNGCGFDSHLQQYTYTHTYNSGFRLNIIILRSLLVIAIKRVFFHHHVGGLEPAPPANLINYLWVAVIYRDASWRAPGRFPGGAGSSSATLKFLYVF